MTDEYLWPVRNVAQYAYCPRLFYMMEVEGIFLPSADTEKGLDVHERVDKPSKKPKISDQDDGNEESADEADNRPQTLRSLTLTSQGLGLSGTLDLVELQGSVALPMEYRKGRPKYKTLVPPPDQIEEDDEEPPLAEIEPWPIDRVQIGLQSILLEEAGYQVHQGLVYYASEKRKLLIAVTEEIKNEALAVLNAAKACAAGSRPLPLVNDNRCVGCSLQPICLPDEVNLQLAQADDDALTPRKLMPLRDDGIHVVAQTRGARVTVQGLTLKIKDKHGEVIKEIPLANLESLALLGSVQITTQAVCALADRNIPLAYLSAAGRMVAMMDPMDSVSALVRKAQIRGFDKDDIALCLSNQLVRAKIINQRTLIMRNNKNLSPEIPHLMSEQARQAEQAESLSQLRGHEGQAAALYFENFSGMLKEPFGREFDAVGRQRRPPPDPVNACLSLAYTMLTHECVTALRLARLEPSIGAYHVSRPGRPALALDLMEPFRPLIADSLTVSLFNRGEVGAGHFMRSSAGCVLTDAGRKAFFQAYGRRMDTEVTHSAFGYRLSYRRMIMLHARMIAAWLLGEFSDLAFLTTR